MEEASGFSVCVLEERWMHEWEQRWWREGAGQKGVIEGVGEDEGRLVRPTWQRSEADSEMFHILERVKVYVWNIGNRT